MITQTLTPAPQTCRESEATVDELEANYTIANNYFESLMEGDEAKMRSVFTPDAMFWTNFSDSDVLIADSIPRWCNLGESFTNLHFEDVRRRGIPGGFLEQHTLCGVDQDGQEMAVKGCFVGTIEDGRVTRLEEYIDPARRYRHQQQ